ncbi:unnamed protein product, partial [Chrysoparadoxa australica]
SSLSFFYASNGGRNTLIPRPIPPPVALSEKLQWLHAFLEKQETEPLALHKFASKGPRVQLRQLENAALALNLDEEREMNRGKELNILGSL